MMTQTGTLKFLAVLVAISQIATVQPARAAEPQSFLGTWQGSFGNGRPNWLIVEKGTAANTATVVYGLGKWGRRREVEFRRQATIENGVLRFGLNNGATLTYRLQQDNSLKGHWARGGRENQWVMAKAVGAPRKTASLADCNDPLPDVIIIPPDSDVPEHYAKFSGIWRGRWGGIVCSRLAFDFIEPSGKVRYVYSWAKSRNNKGGYRSGYDNISDGKIEFGGGAKFTFWMDEGGAMKGKRQAGRASEITMEKVEAN